VTPPRQRGWLEVRWRQARNPPPPVLRAVLANLGIASVGALLLLVYEIAIGRGASLPGGDLRTPLVALYVAVVVSAGSLLTYLWVELPTGAHGRRRRSGWAAMLGLFAAVPICYLALVVTFQIVHPLFG
jgi:hypothetical protein